MHKKSKEPGWLGDMRSPEDESLRWVVSRNASSLSIQLAKMCVNTWGFKYVASYITPEKIRLWLELKLRQPIFSLLRDLYVKRWKVAHGIHVSNRFVSCDDALLGQILQNIWPGGVEFPLVVSPSFHRERLMFRARGLWERIGRIRLRTTPSVQQIQESSSRQANIGVHYSEGITQDGRSDLFWLSRNGINPKRVLVFIDDIRPEPNEFLCEQVIRDIEQLGVSWVCLTDGVVERKNIHTWSCGWSHGDFVKDFSRLIEQERLSDLDEWLVQVLMEMLTQVDYWKKFLHDFNIRILLDASEGFTTNVSQNIALDLLDGIHVGRQRSELTAAQDDRMRMRIHHVYFCWNNRARDVLHEIGDLAENLVVTGFPQDQTCLNEDQIVSELRSRLERNGVKFIVVLFDNMFSDDLQFSMNMVASFYHAFLNWVTEDQEVGLIVKSKKPVVLERLPEVRSILAEEEARGRCLVLDRQRSRLPAKVARAADVAVGLGISSSVIESAIVGTRGIHCDLTKTSSNPFYRWGYGRFVFDDVDEMMRALKKAKQSGFGESTLGDHAMILDQIDPFRDGKASERVEYYLSSLLDGYDAGSTKKQSILRANEEYIHMNNPCMVHIA